MNDWMMQFQADLLGVPVRRPAMVETTAFGAAGLAGVALGFWSSADDFLSARAGDTRFDPVMTEEAREHHFSGWRRALAATRTWAAQT